MSAALDTEFHLMRHARIAILAIALFCGVGFVAGGLIPFEGAVVSGGTVVVEGNVKKVQHQTGGTIGAILVKDGDVVREGDVVARLDATAVKANLGVVIAELNTYEARAARLIAERDGHAAIAFSASLLARAATDPAAQTAIETERRLFESRRNVYEGQKTQLRERIEQAEREAEGLDKQLSALGKSQVIAERDRAMLEPLIRQGLVQRPRYTQLDREIERNIGSIGDTTARIQMAKTRAKEIQIQVDQIDRDRLAEVSKELREAQAKVEEMTQRRLSAEDQLTKADIRAPASGTVHKLAIHTIGGVINQAEALMTIVPNPDALVVEVRIAPIEKDRIRERMNARVRFSSFNQRITPELNAIVTRVSPKDTTDQKTGVTYFTAILKLLEGETAKLHGAQLVPGMQAETFITTDQRTVLGFLTKQFFDYLALVFRGR